MKQILHFGPTQKLLAHTYYLFLEDFAHKKVFCKFTPLLLPFSFHMSLLAENCDERSNVIIFQSS